ncbi:MAG: hypothetical protein IKQ16_08815 [Lentisphaeria bacterium]|nr:hypothetical protein [Lentisphaeria bacterium]
MILARSMRGNAISCRFEESLFALSGKKKQASSKCARNPVSFSMVSTAVIIPLSSIAPVASTRRGL